MPALCPQDCAAIWPAVAWMALVERTQPGAVHTYFGGAPSPNKYLHWEAGIVANINEKEMIS